MNSGSVVALSNISGEIVEWYDYDVFGEPTIYTGKGADGLWRTSDDTTSSTSAVDNPYMFTGRRLDDETGLYYYRARYYKPDIGRFLQTDPIGYFDNMNLYAYVGNNPLIWLDPYGLYELEWKGRWTEKEKGRILNAMKDIRARCDVLSNQINNELNTLPNSLNYNTVRQELNNLKGILSKVSQGIASNTENLELYQRDFRKDSDTEAMWIKPFPWWWTDDEIHFNTRTKYDWHSKNKAELGTLLLHELTHIYGTTDDYSLGDYMNAHIIDDLIRTDISSHIFYRYKKMQAEKAGRCKSKN